MTRRPLLLAVAALVAVAAAAVAVAVWPAANERPAAPRLTGEPLRMGRTPLFAGPSDVRFAEGNRDVLLFLHGNQHLTVVDADTGARRWDDRRLGALRYRPTVHNGLAERHLVGAGVLVGYQSDDEAGLMLLSTTDGSVRWRTPVMPADGGPARPLLRAVDDRVAVVTMATRTPFEDPREATRTIGFDVRTGARLWELPGGAWAEQIVGDTLLSVVAPTDSDDRAPASTVVAHHVLTGKSLWHLTDRYPTAELMAAAGEVALVRAGSELLVLSAATGRELAGHPVGDRWVDCRSDHRTTIACTVSPAHEGARQEVLGIDGTGRLATLPSESMPWHGVWDGRVFLGDEDRVYTVDSTGRRTGGAGRLPGRLLLLTENRAVFTHVSDDTAQAQVYDVDTRP